MSDLKIKVGDVYRKTVDGVDWRCEILPHEDNRYPDNFSLAINRYRGDDPCVSDIVIDVDPKITAMILADWTLDTTPAESAILDAEQIAERCNAGRCPTLAAVHEQLAVANRENAALREILNQCASAMSGFASADVTMEYWRGMPAGIRAIRAQRDAAKTRPVTAEMVRDAWQARDYSLPWHPFAAAHINAAICIPPKCPGCGADAVQVSEPVWGCWNRECAVMGVGS